jgi:hypothetical protein
VSHSAQASYLFRRLAPRQALANVSVYAACTRPAAVCSRTGVVPRPYWQRRKLLCRKRYELFCYLFLLVTLTRTVVLKIRTVSVRVRLGALSKRARQGAFRVLSPR